jgi:hypothetical protein
MLRFTYDDHVGDKRMRMNRRYLVKTDHGDVLVEINEACTNALQSDLLILQEATPENTRDLSMEVPLRAFGAKMVEIIEMVGTGDFTPSPKMREMMIKEKAAEDLNRIERWARDRR